MSDQTKRVVEDKSEPLSEQEKVNLFISKYSALCEEYQLQIVVMPVFVARDDGTFSVKLNSSVGKLPKRE